MLKCTKCGASLRTDSEYCSQCGCEVEYYFCAFCNIEWETDDNFCHKCGVSKKENDEKINKDRKELEQNMIRHENAVKEWEKQIAEIDKISQRIEDEGYKCLKKDTWYGLDVIKGIMGTIYSGDIEVRESFGQQPFDVIFEVRSTGCNTAYVNGEEEYSSWDITRKIGGLLRPTYPVARNGWKGKTVDLFLISEKKKDTVAENLYYDALQREARKGWYNL